MTAHLNGHATAAAGSVEPKRPSVDALLTALPPTTRDEVVAALNEEYALILVGDRPAVLRESTTADGLRDFKLLSVTGFREWLRPRKVFLHDRPIPASTIWLNSGDRREYEGFDFSPGQPPRDRYYDLWTGWAVEPSEEGSCARFLEHIAENVCGGDDALYSWVIGWFAAIVQRPTEKLGTSIALRGPQGVGKSIIGDEIGKLFGRHYQSVASDRFVTGRFNAHLLDCLLLQLEEATWGGDHSAAGKLKDLITGTHQLIEYKGKEPIRLPNYVRVLITSNNEWVVPAGLEERRFCVLDVGEAQIQNGPYFAKIRRELDANGGRGRRKLLHHLLTMELSDIPLRQVPSTAGLFSQQVASLSSEMAWWLDVLMAGQLPGDKAGEGWAPTHAIHQHYAEHAHLRGTQRRSSETSFGMLLRRYVPIERVRKTVMDAGAGKQSRPWCWSFPPLAECRRQFAERTRTAPVWDEPDATWGGPP